MRLSCVLLTQIFRSEVHVQLRRDVNKALKNSERLLIDTRNNHIVKLKIKEIEIEGLKPQIRRLRRE